MRRSNQPSQTPLRRPRSTAQHMSLAAAIDAFMLHQESTDSQPKTLTWHQHCLGSFRNYCDHHKIMMIEAVTTQDLQHWVIELQKEVTTRGVRSGRTISWYARSTKAFFRWCCRRGYMAEDVTTWLELPKVEKPLIRIFDNDEFSRLLAACTPDVPNRSTGPHHVARNEAMLWVLFDTGIRLSELTDLKLANFDRTRGTIIVFGKGRKERKIALGKNALHALGRYLTHWRSAFPSAQESSHVFLAEKGPITTHGIQMLLKRLQVRAGLQDRRVHPHLFRHTFAVHYLMRGGDIFTLQELLGHEDMETIRNYMHLADANVQAQKRKFRAYSET